MQQETIKKVTGPQKKKNKNDFFSTKNMIDMSKKGRIQEVMLLTILYLSITKIIWF